MRIINARFRQSAALFKQLPRLNVPEFAFIGRSNVGKSSLLNTLINRKKLAQISKKPGKTRTINLFDISAENEVDAQRFSVSFADLPGYGYAKVDEKTLEMWRMLIEEYIDKRENLCGIVILVDIRHELQDKDRHALIWMSHFNIPCIVVATKADKLSKNKQQQQVSLLKKNIFSLPDISVPELIAFSTETAQGKKEIWQWIYRCCFNESE